MVRGELNASGTGAGWMKRRVDARPRGGAPVLHADLPLGEERQRGHGAGEEGGPAGSRRRRRDFGGGPGPARTAQAAAIDVLPGAATARPAAARHGAGGAAARNQGRSEGSEAGQDDTCRQDLESRAHGPPLERQGF